MSPFKSLQLLVSNFGLQFSPLHRNMGQNSHGFDWFGNVFKKIEDKCLEICVVMEKEVLKYVKGQPNLVGNDEDHSQQQHSDVREDESPEKEHWANQTASSASTLCKSPEEHLLKTVGRVTIQSPDKQKHPIIEPNHFTANQEVCGALKIENKNAKANISRSSRKQSAKANAITEEIVNFSPSTIQNDEFLNWEIV